MLVELKKSIIFVNKGELSNWLAQQTVNLSRKPWGFESLLSHQDIMLGSIPTIHTKDDTKRRMTGVERRVARVSH